MAFAASHTYDDLLRAIHTTRRRWRLKVLLRGLAFFLIAGFVDRRGFGMGARPFPLRRRAGGGDPQPGVDRAARARHPLPRASVRETGQRPAGRALHRGARAVARGRAAVGGRARRCGPPRARRRRAVWSTVWSSAPSPALRRSSGAPPSTGRCCAASRRSRRDRLWSGSRRSCCLRPSCSTARWSSSLPWKSDALASPYGIEVLPGSVTVARGSDLEVRAQLSGFDSEAVELAVKRGEGNWERWPMPADGEPGDEALHAARPAGGERVLRRRPVACARRSIASMWPTFPTSRRSISSTGSRPTPACRRSGSRTAATSPLCAAPKCGWR